MLLSNHAGSPERWHVRTPLASEEVPLGIPPQDVRVTDTYSYFGWQTCARAPVDPDPESLRRLRAAPRNRSILLYPPILSGLEDDGAPPRRRPRLIPFCSLLYNSFLRTRGHLELDRGPATAGCNITIVYGYTCIFVPLLISGRSMTCLTVADRHRTDAVDRRCQRRVLVYIRVYKYIVQTRVSIKSNQMIMISTTRTVSGNRRCSVTSVCQSPFFARDEPLFYALLHVNIQRVAHMRCLWLVVVGIKCLVLLLHENILV